jgi:acyl-CoA hydrolase/GNAT superfamily N-acetyltransferase
VIDWKKRFAAKVVSAEAAAAQVKNGDRVYLGSMCAEPRLLVKALAASRLEDVEIVQLKAGGEASILAAKPNSGFRLKTFFLGRQQALQGGPSEADYVPLFHSEIPSFFRSRRIPIDVALVQVSEPDRFGQVSLGVSVDITRSAVECARTVIAQVNPKMPRTLGNTFFPVERIHSLVAGEEDLLEIEELKLTEVDRRVASFCNQLIEDGSVIQVGFAGLSQALAQGLMGRRDLGVHSEMFTDPLIDLIEAGVVTNATKQFYRGKSLATFCLGTRRLYDYVDTNPLFEFHTSDVVLNPSFIATNQKMVAINIALQVDLRGQIRQGSPGWSAFEGSGGDHDFMRGASLSKGGRSIVCLRSTSPSGRSNIVANFQGRAAVMMNRGEVHYVVTEFGVAALGGKSVRERALALIEVAHPDHREALLAQARDEGYVYRDHSSCRVPSLELQKRVYREHVFKGGLKARVRTIRCSDEAMLRDLFYQLSDESVYARYFSPIKSMPHHNLEVYSNLDESIGLSLVVIVGPEENQRMIAEGRYVFGENEAFPDVAIMVDENYQRRGIGAFLLDYLIELAKERGIKGLQADILATNEPMLKIFERLPYVVHSSFKEGVLSMRFRFDELKP